MTDFDDFDAFLGLDRVIDLALAPDGSTLVATVASLNKDGNKLVNALWSVDPAGEQPARRLTRSDKGESGPVFAADGSVLFTSTRGADDDDEPAALWRLPAGPGEPRKVLERPGGVAAVKVARDAGTVIISSPVLPGSVDGKADQARRKARKDAKVSAILHTAAPVRYWDHDLGPDELHLLRLSAFGADDQPDADGDPRDLTPAPGRALDEVAFAASPDGATVVTAWSVPDDPSIRRTRLVAIDAASGEQRVLAEEPWEFYGDPDVSRDGASVVAVRMQDLGYDDPPRVTLRLFELASGQSRDLVDDQELWPGSPVFSVDGTAIFFTADQCGHRPIFRVSVATGAVTRVSGSGHYTNVLVAPDGRTLYALRDHIDSPPTPVRLDSLATDGEAIALPAPGAATVPGHVEEITTTAADGTEIRAWLALPAATSAQQPAPLLLWIHGGPLSSWNGWSWRWNPWLLVAKGYAVLLPDPALSTGYGEQMLHRGWGEWGGAPYSDLMAMTDAAQQRPDIDDTKVAAMGGSYGGYLANWIAGHTDRFRCLVTHASLWALDQFAGTTDDPANWAREWGLPTDQPERYAEWSPHHFADNITTPMLVVHGDKDYRVPIGDGLRLWWDLQRRGVESSYLYFPDEGHWVLQPGNARVWYETVWAWLATHVHGEK
ncbi:MAG: S9 family peptidase, partial [Pseudonocardiales bacterium]